MIRIMLAALAAYLLGGFPTSYLTGRLFYRLDLRLHGSGNLGSTNVFRVLGWKPALIVLAVDILKGFAAAWWLPQLLPGGGGVLARIVLGLAVVAGHIFSPFVALRGGKGVATAAGVVLAIAPAAMLLSLAVWLVVMLLTRIVSVASLSAALTLPLGVLLTTERVAPQFGIMVAFSLVISLAVVLTHRSNIARLLRGEEKKLTAGRR